MLCNELTSKEATYGKINLLYINPYFVQPTHLTNCFIEAALFASYTSFHNKERSSEVEIVLFFSHFGYAATGKGSDLWGLELFVKGGIIDLANVKSMKKRSLNLHRCYVTS